MIPPSHPAYRTPVAGRAPAKATPEALASLEAWRWPDNVRELENEIRRAMALSTGPIGPAVLSDVARNVARA